MARPLRLEFAEALYHVTLREKNKGAFLKQYWERIFFLYDKYIFTKLAWFFLWLPVSLSLYLLLTKDVVRKVTKADVRLFMIEAHVLGIFVSILILWIPWLLLKMPLTFGLFDTDNKS